MPRLRRPRPRPRDPRRLHGRRAHRTPAGGGPARATPRPPRPVAVRPRAAVGLARPGRGRRCSPRSAPTTRPSGRSATTAPATCSSPTTCARPATSATRTRASSLSCRPAQTRRRPPTRRGVNTEHTWPQSKGARDEPLRSDMHHLFPVRDEVNSSRGNLPYGEVPDDRADAWYTLDVSQSRAAGRAPRAVVRARHGPLGAARRRQGQRRPGRLLRRRALRARRRGERRRRLFRRMRPDLLAWNRAGPAGRRRDGALGVDRHAAGHAQPVRAGPDARRPRLRRGVADGAGAVPAAPSSPRSAPAAAPRRRRAPGARRGPPRDVWIAGLHYDNAGDDRDEAVTLAGPPGPAPRRLVARARQRLGRARLRHAPARRRRSTARAADASRPRASRTARPTASRSSTPDGRVAEFVSYEGTVTATDGPAAGRRPTTSAWPRAGATRPATLPARPRPPRPVGGSPLTRDADDAAPGTNRADRGKRFATRVHATGRCAPARPTLASPTRLMLHDRSDARGPRRRPRPRLALAGCDSAHRRDGRRQRRHGRHRGRRAGRRAVARARRRRRPRRRRRRPSPSPGRGRPRTRRTATRRSRSRPGCAPTRTFDAATFVYTLTSDCSRTSHGGRFSASFSARRDAPLPRRRTGSRRPSARARSRSTSTSSRARPPSSRRRARTA